MSLFHLFHDFDHTCASATFFTRDSHGLSAPVDQPLRFDTDNFPRNFWACPRSTDESFKSDAEKNWTDFYCWAGGGGGGGGGAFTTLVFLGWISSPKHFLSFDRLCFLLHIFLGMPKQISAKSQSSNWAVRPHTSPLGCSSVAFLITQ